MIRIIFDTITHHPKLKSSARCLASRSAVELDKGSYQKVSRVIPIEPPCLAYNNIVITKYFLYGKYNIIYIELTLQNNF